MVFVQDIAYQGEIAQNNVWYLYEFILLTMKANMSLFVSHSTQPSSPLHKCPTSILKNAPLSVDLLL